MFRIKNEEKKVQRSWNGLIKIGKKQSNINLFKTRVKYGCVLWRSKNAKKIDHENKGNGKVG